MMLEEHAGIKRRITKAPVEQLDGEGQRILDRIGAAARLRHGGYIVFHCYWSGTEGQGGKGGRDTLV